jgi:hypothetical protein
VFNGQAPARTEKPGISPPTSESNGFLNRTNARKSRLTDGFLDAKERLEEELIERMHAETASLSLLDTSVPSAHVRHTRIVLSADTVNTPMGIEVFYT